MLHRLLQALLIALLITMTSCHEQALQLSVKIADMQCPMEIDEGMTMQHIDMKNGRVTYHALCDEDSYDMDSLKSLEAELKVLLLEALCEDEDSKEMVKLCKKSSTDIIFEYTGMDSKKVVEVLIPHEDMY